MAVVAACGAAAGAPCGIGPRRAAATPSAAGALPPATATVTRQTLADTRDADGELGYGPRDHGGQPAGRGTVTWLPDSGDQVTRGKPLYQIDNEPVVLHVRRDCPRTGT